MDEAAKRREPRIRTVLSVRVFGLDSSGKPFTDVAHTLDISKGGARLGGLKYSLAVGDVVGVQRGTDKARFQVIWVGAPHTRCEGQAGIHCVQPEKCIWPAEPISIKKEDDYVPLPTVPVTRPLAVHTLSAERERRTHNRHPCNLGAELQVEHSAVKLWARCTDLSSGGCYLETRSPLAPGTSLRLQLSNKTMTFNSWGVVRTSHPHFGMGIRFDNLDEPARVVLDMVLETLGEEANLPNTPVPISRTDLRRQAAAVAEDLRLLQQNLAGCDDPPAITSMLGSALKGMFETMNTIQQMIDSPLREHPELVSEQLIRQRIRAATSLNLELCDRLTAPLPHGAAETRELLQATTTLMRRLQGGINQEARETATATSELQPHSLPLLEATPEPGHRPI